MSFTTQLFIFIFFPVAVAVYGLASGVERIKLLSAFAKRIRMKDWGMVVVSFVFYAWSGIMGAKALAVYILGVYLGVRVMDFCRRKRLILPVFADEGKECSLWWKISIGKVLLVFLAIALVYVLARSKYYDFAMSVWADIMGKKVKSVHLFVMLGLSFLTFSAISYAIDVYKEKASAGSLLDCALYLSFFPKIVSGPIVLWRDFKPQLASRVTSFDMVIEGINRIMIGFAKKLILADSFDACIAQMDPACGIDIITAWGAVLLYMLQIYYDFSGYSDIAIGLSLLFGFRCKENFNFPYRSRSITEFWRRWHISLGSWFKEYVYIPLGGSRQGKKRTLINLAVVFVLTGIWHGAGWMFIIWGTLNGAAVLIERLIRDKSFYQKTPEPIKWLAAFFFTMFAWEFFRFTTIDKLVEWAQMMIGAFTFERNIFTYEFYFTNRIIFLTVVGLLGATLLGDDHILTKWKNFTSSVYGMALQEVGLLGLFLLSLMFMINSGYKPFIYFQF